MSQPQADAPWQQVVTLLSEGRPLESILSGWRLTEQRVAELLLMAWRDGVVIKPEWILPTALRDQVLQTMDERSDLSPMELSSAFKGRISPAMFRALRTIRGEGRGLDTQLFDGQTFFERFHDDVAGARKEVIIVAPEIKSRHWRRYLDGLRHVLVQQGQVAFFTGRVSELVVQEIRDERIVIIEKRTNANLAIVDDSILWEGSMNFLLPPNGEEHVRRVKSRFQCDEVREIHDLFL